MILRITTLPSATSAGCRGGGLLAASPVPRATPAGGSAARWSRRAPRTRSRRSRGRRSSRRSARPARCAGRRRCRGHGCQRIASVVDEVGEQRDAAAGDEDDRLEHCCEPEHAETDGDRAHARRLRTIERSTSPWLCPWSCASRTSLHCNRHEAGTDAFREGGYGSPVPTAIATPWGKATLVDEVRVQQRAGDKRFSSLVQLLEVKDGERLVRFAYATNGAARRGPVTLRARDLEKLRAALRERPELT